MQVLSEVEAIGYENARVDIDEVGVTLRWTDGSISRMWCMSWGEVFELANEQRQNEVRNGTH